MGFHVAAFLADAGVVPELPCLAVQYGVCGLLLDCGRVGRLLKFFPPNLESLLDARFIHEEQPPFWSNGFLAFRREFVAR